MEYVRLGSTGLEVSPICFGTDRFGKDHEDRTDDQRAHDLLDAFDERGGNFIDTANKYGGGQSERWIGEWLVERDREDYVLASKCYWSDVSRFQANLSRKNVRAEVAGSLEKLGTDYLDVLYLHRFDDETPIECTLRTLDDLVSEGKVYYVGISSCDAWKLTQGLWQADVNNYEAFTVTQPQYSAAYQDPVAEYLDVCADQDLAVCPYSPLHGGFLTGKYERVDDGEVEAPDGSRGALRDYFTDRYLGERVWEIFDTVANVADETGATPAQVSLRWLMDHERFTCVPVIGVRTVEQLEENLGAIAIELTDDQFDRINRASDGDK